MSDFPRQKGKEGLLVVPRTVFGEGACAVPEVQHVGWTQYAEADAEGLREHVHEDAFEICYLVRGNATWWVGQEVLEVSPGSLFVTWPGEVHGGVDGAMHPCELFWLQVVIPQAGTTLDLSARETAALRAGFDALSHRMCRAPHAVCGHFERVLGVLSAPGPLTGAVVRSAVRLLCVDVLQCFAEEGERQAGPRRCSARVEAAIQWFHRHMDRQVSVEEAAEAVGLRPSYFREAFRKETGFSPVEFLAQVRMREAKRLLVESRRSVTEIAFGLGFVSSQYFSTVFRRHTGLTPTGYRKRRRGQAVAKR